MRVRFPVRLLQTMCLALFTLGGSASAQWIQNGLPHQGYISCFAAGRTGLLAGTDGGVFLSADSGATWGQINTGLTDTHVDAIAVSDTTLFCGTYGGGVFLSRNNGAGWVPVNNGLTDTHVSTLAARGTRLFAATWGGLWISTNGGGSWAQVTTGLGNRFVYAFAANGPLLFAGTWAGVFVSADSGGTWTPASAGLTNPWVFALAVSGGKIFAGTQDGVFLSTNNGGNWISASTGLKGKTVLSLAAGGANLFAGTYGAGVYLSSNSGLNWIPVNAGAGNMFVRALAVSGTYLLAGTYFGGSWRSTVPDLFASFTSFSVNAGWNLVSVPRVPQDPSASVLFPGATPGTFYRYANGTFQQVAGLNTGEGYWAFYDSPGANTISGTKFTSASVTVPTGNRWVLVGSLAGSAPTSALTSGPAGAIEPGTVFGWNGSLYVHPTTLEPGHGYWVFVNSPCTLTISSSGANAAGAEEAAGIPLETHRR